MQRAAALLFGWLVIAAWAADDTGFRAGVFEPPREAPDFSLQGSDGRELKLSQYRGKVVVLAFGFTSCTNVCPVTLAVLANARKRLGVDGDDFQLIYVTVDPERDDARRMRDYLAAFDSTFVGGTGDHAALAAVRDAYGILASKRADGQSYTVSHSSYTYLIDRQGRLRALMPFGHTAEDYVHDVEMLLRQ